LRLRRAAFPQSSKEVRDLAPSLLSDARLQQARSLALDGVRHIQRRAGWRLHRTEIGVAAE